jgi:hypothetical protein
LKDSKTSTLGSYSERSLDRSQLSTRILKRERFVFFSWNTRGLPERTGCVVRGESSKKKTRCWVREHPDTVMKLTPHRGCHTNTLFTMKR